MAYTREEQDAAVGSLKSVFAALTPAQGEKFSRFLMNELKRNGSSQIAINEAVAILAQQDGLRDRTTEIKP